MAQDIVWSLTARVAYKDGATREVAVLKDFGPSRIVNNEDYQALTDIVNAPSFTRFLATLGYIAGVGGMVTVPTTIKDYEFRFMAIVTSGQSTHVAGSNKDLSPVIQSDDLSTTLALLESDNDFVSLMNKLLIYPDVYAVACGWQTPTDYDGKIAPFTIDQYCTTSIVAGVTDIIDLSGVINPAPMAVYQVERWDNATYTFPNLIPNKNYTIRLHFAELVFSSIGAREFNVVIQGTQVLTDFDVFAATGAKLKAIVKTFTTTADANGNIIIDFVNGAADKAKIDGIEIL